MFCWQWSMVWLRESYSWPLATAISYGQSYKTFLAVTGKTIKARVFVLPSLSSLVWRLEALPLHKGMLSALSQSKILY
jgi:hypothetical protein